MAKFFFTFGREGQPYSGGWTEVEAPSAKDAAAAFRAYHPDKHEGILNCADMYTEEQFNSSGMNKEDGNLGSFCHEVITLRRNRTYICQDCGERFTSEDLREFREMGEVYHKEKSCFLCPDCYDSFQCMTLEDQMDFFLKGERKA